MPYCPKCKVALAPGSEFCPLCLERSVVQLGTVPADHTPMSYADVVRDADEREKLSPAEIRQMVFELLCVSFGILLLVTLGIDFLVLGGITWSRYTSIIFIVCWLYSAMPLVFWGKPWLTYAVLGPSLLVAVFLWSVFSGTPGWFLPLALPITLFLEAAVVSSFTLIAIQKLKGLNTVGILLAATSFLCVGIDGAINFYLRGIPSLSWSVVVIISAIPVAGFFFYLHYRVTNQASLRKIFRL